MGTRNAYCSFCRKSYRDVGPLVEGPGEVYICAECVELCQSIIEQEKRRRSPAGRGPSLPGPETIRARLDQLVNGQEAKRALALAAHRLQESGGPRQVLLIGPTRSSKVHLARCLAHALEGPFAAGDASALVGAGPNAEAAVPLLYELLLAGDFDIEAAQCGVVYVDGVDRREAQEALLRLWDRQVIEVREGADVAQGIKIDIRNILFVCGGTFAGLDDAIVRLGRHPEQPVTGDALIACGVLPDLIGRLGAFARVAPFDEEMLTRIVPWVDLSGMAGKGTASGGGQGA
jgi:ATP-dependent Clp protease ATP-binding subunit ClpX